MAVPVIVVPHAPRAPRNASDRYKVWEYHGFTPLSYYDLECNLTSTRMAQPRPTT